MHKLYYFLLSLLSLIALVMSLVLLFSASFSFPLSWIWPGIIWSLHFVVGPITYAILASYYFLLGRGKIESNKFIVTSGVILILSAIPAPFYGGFISGLAIYVFVYSLIAIALLLLALGGKWKKTFWTLFVLYVLFVLFLIATTLI